MEQTNTNIEQKMGKNIIIIIATIIVLILIGAWWWQKDKKSSILPVNVPEQGSAGLGGQLYESVNNPVENKVPETNPFNTETNPLKGVYKNPFE